MAVVRDIIVQENTITTRGKKFRVSKRLNNAV